MVSGKAVWDANTEEDFSHYIYKYWNNISTSAYNSTSSAWTTTTANNEISGSFNQGEGTHYFCIIAVDNADNQSECSETFTIIYDTNSPEPTSNTNTQTITGDTAVGENQPGWLFNRDTSTQSPFSFVLGTSTVGTGSLFINPITNTINGNNDKFIAELFLLSPIVELDSLSYDFNIAAVDANDENEFYMSVYANFGTSSSTNYYDCRYNVVPTVGLVGGWTTVTFDPSSTYPVTTRGSSPFACPASPAAMDTLASGSTIRAIAINVGDTSANDLGVSGYLDNVVVVQTTGLHTETTVYDFEPVEVVDEETEGPVVSSFNSGAAGGGGGSSSNNQPQGQVLGASTDNDMYQLLENIKNRLYELLAASSQSSNSTAAFQGSVLGASVAQAQNNTANEEGVVEEIDEISTSTPATTAKEENENASNDSDDAAWTWSFWLLVLLWLVATLAAFWRQSTNPQSTAMKVVQSAFCVVALILLAVVFSGGFVGAFWPSLIVAVGSITTYFWATE